MSEDEDIPIAYKPGTLTGESEATVDKADAEEYSENLLGQNFIERATEVATKGRRYVEDPSDAPEDVEVEQGPQGGYYYETGSSGDEGGSEDSNTADGETLWEAELATNYNEGDNVVVDTERVGEIEGTIPEGGLDFLEYDELIIEDTQGNDHVIPTGDIQGIEPRGGSGEGEAVDTDQGLGETEALDAISEGVVDLRAEDEIPQEAADEMAEELAANLDSEPDATDVYGVMTNWLEEEGLAEQVSMATAEGLAEEIRDNLRANAEWEEEKGADPKDEDVQEAAEYLAQELGGDVEPNDVLDAVQTNRRVQPDDE